MSESPTPSPLPWKVQECSGLHDWMIVDANGASVAEVCWASGYDKEHADKIVRSVNAHAALVEALRQILNWTEGISNEHRAAGEAALALAGER